MAAAAAGRGHLRAARSDREQVIEVLKGAFVQGRLTKDEFDTRVDRTFTSRTYAELAVITADIPAMLTGAGPRRMPRRRSPRQAVAWSTGVVIAAAVLMAALLIGNGRLTYLAVSAVCGAGFVAVAQMLHSRQRRRFGGAPGAGAARPGSRGQVRALAISRVRPAELRSTPSGPFGRRFCKAVRWAHAAGIPQLSLLLTILQSLFVLPFAAETLARRHGPPQARRAGMTQVVIRSGHHGSRYDAH
jgi:hypothetical protein